MRIKVPKYVADRLVGLSKKDFQIHTFKGSGPGGQHRNKVETAVRITHTATGISAEATDNKSQSRNKKEAFGKLVRKLVSHYTSEETSLCTAEAKAEGKIRTYNEQRRTVKDHRTGIEADYSSVLDGDIDCFIEAMTGNEGER